ncbi:hypothetical protein ACFU96_45395 [Streptomyces sp. NPDC057620]|uniref:rhamnogalacturonan lyase family protein n=1 Tax=Streptomyces sp. NPDC057620 TaxID=3346185 RepID=UPI0036B63B60
MHAKHRRSRAVWWSVAMGSAAVAASLALLTDLSPLGIASTDRPPTTAPITRPMENLGRGVVAVRSSATDVLVSWRLLGLDPESVGFNVYRSSGKDGAYTRLNAQVLTKGTNFTDTTADLTADNRYQVRPVVDGHEQDAGPAFALTADHAQEPVVRIPLRNGAPIKFTWVGDLDGDGEYDYVVDRQTAPRTIEAYRSDGTFLWSMNMGPNSVNLNNIEGGSSGLDTGNWDGVTVYDFDSDGRAEVAVRIANGVTFGDGTTFTNSDDDHQFIAMLDGMSGAPRATAPVPDDYIADGPMYARFAVGYLDGHTPTLVAFMKNRVGRGGMNLMLTAWTFNGTSVERKWKWLRGNQDAADGHNTRVIDVDGDGKDEVVEIGFVLNGDGTLRYSLAGQGIQHGDRFYIAKMDPDRPGLQGYGVQQDNKSGLREYYYDATDGSMIWKHEGKGIIDVGRGLVGDIDPDSPGMEAWSFSGLHNAPSDELLVKDTAKAPWPGLGLWWDGDTGMELLNDGKIEKWNPDSPSGTTRLPRVLTAWKYGAKGFGSANTPALVADLFGDWREEAVYTNTDNNELIIFSTNQPTNTRLYTLAHNPAYRNDMTVKGYVQSHEVDYYLGSGMTRPPRPAIAYAGKSAEETATPAASASPSARHHHRNRDHHRHDDDIHGRREDS